MQIEKVFGSPNKWYFTTAENDKPSGRVIYKTGNRNNGRIRLVFGSTGNNTDAQICVGYGYVEGSFNALSNVKRFVIIIIKLGSGNEREREVRW